MIRLGVNVDHVATLRQARGGKQPEPLEAAFACEKAGAHSITVHLREDQRHIQSHDVIALKKKLTQPLNLEMAIHPFVIKLALEVAPHQITLVPEKRKELTTEGGLDAQKGLKRIQNILPEFKNQNIGVSLFIDPEEEQIRASADCGVQAIELHTGEYANAHGKRERNLQLKRLMDAARLAHELGLHVHAGHGLDYQNTQDILALPALEELNIGHAIVAHAVFVGMEQAVKEMLAILQGSQASL